MNCDFLFSGNGSFFSAKDISLFEVKKIKDGYYAIIAYVKNQGEIILSEGWSTLESAQRCLEEFIKAICNALGKGDGLFKVTLPSDFCPREYAQSYIDDLSNMGKAKMEEIYTSTPLGKYDELARLTQEKLDSIF